MHEDANAATRIAARRPSMVKSNPWRENVDLKDQTTSGLQLLDANNLSFKRSKNKTLNPS